MGDRLFGGGYRAGTRASDADPDGDPLTQDTRSAHPGVATAAAAEDLVTLAALARGAATITVTATDPDGLEASRRFEVTVPNRGPRTIAPLPELELAPGDEATVDVSSHFHGSGSGRAHVPRRVVESRRGGGGCIR